MYFVSRSWRTVTQYARMRGLPRGTYRSLRRLEDVVGVRWVEGDRLIDLDGWWDLSGDLRHELELRGFPAPEFRDAIPDLIARPGRRVLATL